MSKSAKEQSPACSYDMRGITATLPVTQRNAQNMAGTSGAQAYLVAIDGISRRSDRGISYESRSHISGLNSSSSGTQINFSRLPLPSSPPVAMMDCDKTRTELNDLRLNFLGEKQRGLVAVRPIVYSSEKNPFSVKINMEDIMQRNRALLQQERARGRPLLEPRQKNSPGLTQYLVDGASAVMDYVAAARPSSDFRNCSFVNKAEEEDQTLCRHETDLVYPGELTTGHCYESCRSITTKVTTRIPQDIVASPADKSLSNSDLWGPDKQALISGYANGEVADSTNGSTKETNMLGFRYLKNVNIEHKDINPHHGFAKCPACDSNSMQEVMVKNCCKHRFCKSCLHTAAENAGSISIMYCEKDCEARLREVEMHALLPDETCQPAKNSPETATSIHRLQITPAPLLSMSHTARQPCAVYNYEDPLLIQALVDDEPVLLTIGNTACNCCTAQIESMKGIVFKGCRHTQCKDCFINLSLKAKRCAVGSCNGLISEDEAQGFLKYTKIPYRKRKDQDKMAREFKTVEPRRNKNNKKCGNK